MSKHFVHFGRSVGAIQAELYGLDSASIKSLGNWNPDTQEDRYSSKLPLKPLRVMAGHNEKKGLFFLPRSGMQPPDDILKAIFPFIEAAEQLSERSSGVSERSSGATLRAFLKLLKYLRVVICQDVATMLSMNIDHVLFKLPVFQTEEFRQYSNGLANYRDTTVNPIDNSMEHLLPGLNQKIDNVHLDLKHKMSLLSSNFGIMYNELQDIPTQEQFQGLINHMGIVLLSRKLSVSTPATIDNTSNWYFKCNNTSIKRSSSRDC